MSGGEGSGNMKAIAEILLTKFDCRVRIITGNNSALKRRLENTLVPEYKDRVEVYGFVDNIQELMFESDVAFVRGSPNVMMESIMCNVPIVITGFLPGQERENSMLITKYNLGVECYQNKNLENVMNDLLANSAEKLNSIRCSQRQYREPKAAKNIAKFVIDMISK
jgi:processive 1,2-diacylglycerol beta-glucosyltransferase